MRSEGSTSNHGAVARWRHSNDPATPSDGAARAAATPTAGARRAASQPMWAVMCVCVCVRKGGGRASARVPTWMCGVSASRAQAAMGAGGTLSGVGRVHKRVCARVEGGRTSTRGSVHRQPMPRDGVACRPLKLARACAFGRLVTGRQGESILAKKREQEGGGRGGSTSCRAGSRGAGGEEWRRHVVLWLHLGQRLKVAGLCRRAALPQACKGGGERGGERGASHQRRRASSPARPARARPPTPPHRPAWRAASPSRR